MSIHVWHYERRDGADREALGKQALALTQALRATEDVRSSRFYWTTPDAIAVVTDAGNAIADGPPSAEAGSAMFGLCDLARETRREQWMDPGTGERTYREAGR